MLTQTACGSHIFVQKDGSKKDKQPTKPPPGATATIRTGASCAAERLRNHSTIAEHVDLGNGSA